MEKDPLASLLGSVIAAAVIFAIAAPIMRRRSRNESEAITQRVGKDGFTSLMYAATVGDIPALAQILATGIDINEADERGDTALMHSARANQLEAVDILLNAGADSQKAAKDGTTPITIANGQGDQMRELFEAASARNSQPTA